VALVVALVELLLLLSACCFADHIRKLQDGGDSEKTNSEKEGIIDSNEEAYSIHHEESKWLFIKLGVNFINILCTNFSYKCRFGSFFYLHAHLLTTYLKAAETTFVQKNGT